MPFVFKTLKEKEKFVKDLQTRSLECRAFIQNVQGLDTKSHPVGGTLNPLIKQFTFTTDVWIPSISLSVTMEDIGGTHAGFLATSAFAAQMLALTFTTTPLAQGISSGANDDPANELASMLTAWTGIYSAVPVDIQIGGTGGFGTRFFDLDPNGIYVPANKPINLFFYSHASDSDATPTFLLKSSIYYIALPA